jgi:hypothetical protein
MKWKPDWPQVQQNLIRWWNREGFAISIVAPRRSPVEDVPEPIETDEPALWWSDPEIRGSRMIHQIANTHYLADSFPIFDTNIGPGSLSLALGSEPEFAREGNTGTVWFMPCIENPETAPPLTFPVQCAPNWWKVQVELVEHALQHNQDRYIVGMPDLIENLDVLASLRGTETVLMDLVERPGWVRESIEQINEVFYTGFDQIYKKIHDEQNGNVFSAFRIWGPGKTAKVQCDISVMISQAMFDEFVKPSLAAQCDWLDYSLFHLDGSGAMQHLESLLDIDDLDGIEWTPEPGLPRGGDPQWYDMYKQIKAAGKSVQAHFVLPEEVIPLIDTVGPEGLFITCFVQDEETAFKLAEEVKPYRQFS